MASDPQVHLETMDPRRVDEAVLLLVESFREDPIQRWCFLADRSGFEDRLRSYFAAGHEWHAGVGEPIHAAFVGGELAGLLYFLRPGANFNQESFEKLRARLEVDCGSEASERFFHFGETMDEHVPEGDIHILSIVGVRPEFRGRGVGGRLVDVVGEACDAHISSRGVGLDTSTDRNTGFYGRHGYEVIAEEAIGPVRQRYLFRTRTTSSLQDEHTARSRE
jgi:GNAT superfamily N-acetyltransferase